MKPNISASAVIGLVLIAQPAIAAGDAPRPVVVELFQSQGCSDCPPANANVMVLSGRPDLITLSFGVTYWDQLGWKDTFASPQYTARQWDYAHAFHRREVFTPEVVVNGRADVVGANRAELEALINRHAGDHGPDLHITGDTVSVGKGDGSETADVWLVRYDPNIVQVPIAGGENGGLTLPHQNVVKALVKLGTWNGIPATYRIPADTNTQWRFAILVQTDGGGAILAAARGDAKAPVAATLASKEISPQ